MPYQTLIASVLHKYVTGRLAEQKAKPTLARRQSTAPKRRVSKPNL
jgi:hypothetical protein